MLESRKMAPYGSGRSPLGILYLGGKNCCSWHRLSPGAKVADHGRAAQAGGRPEKTESERLHRPSRTLTTSKTRAYSEFPKAFGDWVGLKPAFRTDQPSVEVSALNGDHRGYVVLVNHSAEPQKVTVFTTSGVHSVSRIAPEGVKPMQIEGSSWKMELGSYEGATVEWK